MPKNDVFDSFKQSVFYVNALRQRPDGKFVLAQKARLERELKFSWLAQLNYCLAIAKDVLPDNAPNLIRKLDNATKKSITDKLKKMPKKEQIANDINDRQATTLERGAKRAIATHSLGKFGIGYDTVNKRAKEFLGGKLSHELSDYRGTIQETTVERISTILYDAYESGKSYQETSKLIQAQGKSGVFSQARGELIATREIGIAYETGNFLPMKEFSDQYPDRQVVKYWDTVGDDRVTEECQANENQGELELDDKFKSGDMTAPREENPRCRCTTITKIY